MQEPKEECWYNQGAGALLRPTGDQNDQRRNAQGHGGIALTVVRPFKKGGVTIYCGRFVDLKSVDFLP